MNLPLPRGERCGDWIDRTPREGPELPLQDWDNGKKHTQRKCAIQPFAKMKRKIWHTTLPGETTPTPQREALLVL